MDWLDRDKQKNRLLDWLNTDSNPFLIVAMDSQEFEDITNWLVALPNINPSIAYLNTDSEVTRFGLLENIVNEIGHAKFPKFISLYESISKMDIQLIINQTIGSEIKTESAINVEGNTIVLPILKTEKLKKLVG